MTTVLQLELKTAGRLFSCSMDGTLPSPAPGARSAVPLLVGVDTTVPPHYSAAPSGDLCTTLKRFFFVVRGENRFSVPFTADSTGNQPLPRSPAQGLSAFAFARPVAFAPCFAAWDSVAAHAAPAARGCAAASQLDDPAFVDCSFSESAGLEVQASVQPGEQSKHGSGDTNAGCLRSATKLRATQLGQERYRGQLTRGQLTRSQLTRSQLTRGQSHAHRDGVPRNSFST